MIVFLIIVFGFMVMYTHHRESFTSLGSGCKNIPPMFKKAFGGIPNEYYPAGSDVASLPLGANETMVFIGNDELGSCANNINGVNQSGNRFVSNNVSYCSEGTRNHFNINQRNKSHGKLYFDNTHSPF